jgi:ATP diphosphatase
MIASARPFHLMPTRRRSKPPTAAVRSRRAAAALARLATVMHVLRSPRGCPWDRAQTHATLRSHLVEETYEAVEAIDRGDLGALAGELGDVLLQIVFHAEIAAEHRRFDLAAVVEGITRKLIRRHPHVFTPTGRPLGAQARRAAGIRTPSAVKQQWEQIKARESARRPGTVGVLTGLPKALPALQRAQEIGRRVAAVGFDWERSEDVLDKIAEELAELRAAATEGPDRLAEELGDLLFSVANLARKSGLDSESALRQANDKFTERFSALEASFDKRGTPLDQAGMAALDRAWQQVKRDEKKHRVRAARRLTTPRARLPIKAKG